MSDSQQRRVQALGAGQAALAGGAWSEARACFLAALCSAETPEALLRLAHLHCRQRRLDEAEALFQRAATPPSQALVPG